MENQSKEFNLESLTSIKNDISNDDSVFRVAGSEFDLPLRVRAFPSSREYELFIKNVEKLVRLSQEYKLWTSYITENLGHSFCAFTKESNGECPTQIHHHPITLYTIVKGVVNHYLSKDSEFSTFDVATKVIELHFQNKVGYVVMLSDLHSKYHNGFLNIPIEFVHGDYKFIMQTYTIEETEYDRICKLCNVHVEELKQAWSKDNYPGINEYESPKSLPANDEKKLLTA